MAEEPEVEQMHASPPAARIVRPYALTAGRTRPVVDLPLEAVLRLETSATRRAWNEDVTGKIVAICDSRSVAEVSALVQQMTAEILDGKSVDDVVKEYNAALVDEFGADKVVTIK